VLGYFLRRLNYDLAPLVLALVLGPMIERSFREAMMISQGDLSVFVTRPISGAIRAVGVAALLLPVALAMLRKKD
jgi:putative tricarboxylic transport membrane protein